MDNIFASSVTFLTIKYVRRVSHMSLVNSGYGLSTSQIRVRVLAWRFELGMHDPTADN